LRFHFSLQSVRSRSAKPRQLEPSRIHPTSGKKREQACAGRGTATCLLPQTPCRPVGTDNTNSGRTYIGLIDTGGVGRYATSRVANCDHNQSRVLHLCRHAVSGNRKDAPPIPTENPALGSLGAPWDSPRKLADDLPRIFCFVPPRRCGRGADAAR
jgi:hypothetical protein